MKRSPSRPPSRRSWFSRILRAVITLVLVTWTLAAVTLVSFRWINPPFTVVQAQRRVQSWISHKPYHKRYTFVRLNQISPDLQHAVVAAEDSRFYQHHGFDWQEIKIAVEEREDGPARGASTITQQLVKNLFCGTGRSYLRKAVEATLVPVAEIALGKSRILEIYLNVVEWGPAVYGAEAASRYHYNTAARSIGRPQAARLAAILPSPLRRRPERMNEYSSIILGRMQQMNW